MKKLCRTCQTERKFEEFNKHLASKDGLDNRCKYCTRTRDRQRYLADIEGQRARSRKKNKETHERNSKYIQEYLLQNPCNDCGESDIIVLEFDHVKTGKYKNIADMASRSSLMKLKQEIEKCVIRCANCHRRKTAKDFWKNTGRLQ